MKNLLGLLKSFQEIQGAIAQIQDDLKKETAQISSGGGLVKVIVNGNQEIVKVEIAPELINMKDKSLLEDLILSAVNEARKKAQEIAQEKVKEVTGGMDIDLT
ncbi:MAG: YbaB/EbfC family nucleoid-associated protein [bacterium]|nr:YbaB/EbfC family nucleoid-associated protein [bacterium]